VREENIREERRGEGEPRRESGFEPIVEVG
jgi:hypothetical protein